MEKRYTDFNSWINYVYNYVENTKLNNNHKTTRNGNRRIKKTLETLRP